MPLFTEDETVEKNTVLNGLVKRQRKAPRRLVRIPGVLDHILHTKTRTFPKKYFTQGRILTNPRDVVNEPSPYRVNCFKAITKPPRKELGNYLVPTDRGRREGCFLDRVWVPDVDIGKVEEVIKVDPGFFNFVRARVEPFSRQNYTNVSRARFLTKLMASFLKENFLWLKEKELATSATIAKLEDELSEIEDSFNEFLEYDFKEAKECHLKAVKVQKNRHKLEQKIDEANSQLKTKRRNILELSARLAEVKRCENLLTALSPEEWASHFKYLTKKRINEKSSEISFLNTKLEQLKQLLGTSEEFLLKTLEDFLLEFSTRGPARHHFTFTTQIIIKTNSLKETISGYMKRIRSTQRELMFIEVRRKECEMFFNDESEYLQFKLSSVLDEIDKEKQEAVKLKEGTEEVTRGMYKDIVASNQVLMDRALIKDLYESTIPDKERMKGIGPLEMLGAVQKAFNNLRLKIKKYPLHQIQAVEANVRSNELHLIEKAEKARQRATQLNNMLKSLKKAYQAPCDAKRDLILSLPGESPFSSGSSGTPDDLPFLQKEIEREHTDFYRDDLIEEVRIEVDQSGSEETPPSPLPELPQVKPNRLQVYCMKSKMEKGTIKRKHRNGKLK